MKKILLLAGLLFIGVSAFSQIKTPVFGPPKKKFTSKSVTNGINKAMDFGTFNGTTDTLGIITVPNTLGKTNVVFIPVAKDSTVYVFTVVEKTAAYIKVKVFTITDGAFDAVLETAVSIDWYIRTFVIVDDIEGA